MKNASWKTMKNLSGDWAVIVEAPDTPWGGWAFFCKDEGSAKLACDVMNYLVGKPTPVAEKSWNS